LLVKKNVFVIYAKQGFKNKEDETNGNESINSR
jgi:hypothetical protein